MYKLRDESISARIGQVDAKAFKEYSAELDKHIEDLKREVLGEVVEDGGGSLKRKSDATDFFNQIRKLVNMKAKPAPKE